MRCIKYATAATLAGALAVAAAASSAYGQYYYGPGFYAGNAYAFEPAPVVPVYPYGNGRRSKSEYRLSQTCRQAISSV
jgi:hypothetical protein